MCLNCASKWEEQFVVKSRICLRTIFASKWNCGSRQRELNQVTHVTNLDSHSTRGSLCNRTDDLKSPTCPREITI